MGWCEMDDAKTQALIEAQRHEASRRSAEERAEFVKRSTRILNAVMFEQDMERAKAEAGPEDWPQDFEHENGMYEGRCWQCRKSFLGHKRTGTCRACYNKRRAQMGLPPV
jgi:hypothetical protein